MIEQKAPRSSIWLSVALAFLLSAGLTQPGWAHDGRTALTSSRAGGSGGNAPSLEPSVSGDGQRVAFTSSASDLAPNDTNGQTDILVHDRSSDEIELASVSSEGTQANGSSSRPQISQDGRFIVFLSHATNLVSNDEDSVQDVFLRDLQTRTTTKISRGFKSIGGQRLTVAANGDSNGAVVSGDGSEVAFTSLASNLVNGDRNGKNDVFLWHRADGTIERVSVSSSGEQANDWSFVGAISSDGNTIIVNSEASNLVPDDTNNMQDVFVRDQTTHTTERVSLSATGRQLDLVSFADFGSVSRDGRFLTFVTSSTDVADEASAPARIDTRPSQVYLVDRHLTGEAGAEALPDVRRLSRSVEGHPQDGGSARAAISANGRWVIFDSLATNLVTDPIDQALRRIFGPQIYLADSKTGSIELISVSTGRQPAFGDSRNPAISAEGLLIAFDSSAPNLVLIDANNQRDVFVRDRADVVPDCQSGAHEAGRFSGLARDLESSPDPRAQQSIHSFSCDVLVPAGL